MTGLMISLVLLTAAVWVVIAVVAAVLRRPGPPVPPVPVRPAVTRRVRANVPHALYCYMHALRPGRIYYGISNEPDARAARHERDPDDQWWMRRSTGVMVLICWYPNRDAARAAERAAVRAGAFAGEDLANDQHNPVRRRTRAIRR